MISLQHAISEIRDNFTSVSWWRNRVFVPFVLGTATRFHPKYPGYDEAVHVMEEDWDTLIILDACRADLFEEVMDLSRFDRYSRAISLGSHSSEWTRRNFTGKKFADTVYVSANPHTTLLASDSFYEIVEMWKGIDIAPNQLDPSRMVEAAIEAHKRHPEKRLIVHLMQPHGTGGLIHDRSSWEETHRETLKHLTKYIFDIDDALDGKTVISADHGQLFHSGPRAVLGLTGHKARLRIPELVYVPWAELDGERRKITSGESSTTGTSRETIDQRLRDLGYHT
jgi:hypothetical protein